MRVECDIVWGAATDYDLDRNCFLRVYLYDRQVFSA
jgi:hypothetical protein